MKRSIFYLLVVLSLSACGDSSEEKIQGSKGASGDSKEVAKQFDPSSVVKLNVADIPSSCATKGKVISAFKWTDKLGENIFIATETGEVISSRQNSDFVLKEAHVYAYHYTVSGNEVKLIKDLHDYVSECEFDVDASFISETIQITDLDSDDTGEIWMMYKSSCLSDFSPSDLKLMMFQNAQKYAMRGETKIDWGDGTFDGGSYKLDDAFKASPEVFQNFAKSMWNNHIDGR